MNMPWVESPFFEKILAQKKLSTEYENIAKFYNENGYVVIQNAFNEEEIQAVIKDMKEKAFNPDFPFENQRDQRRSQDLWHYSEPAKHMACKPEMLAILKMLYDREPIPFQTLNFQVGSEQRAHSDTLHFSSLPARFMCGVWVALEDITDENGPLFYYPGSHKTPEYNFSHFSKEIKDTSYGDYPQYEDFMEELMEAGKYKKTKFYAKKGDALIWAANIVHGGSPVTNPATTRNSQVTHYYFEDCIYYTPMLSNMVTGEYKIRKHLINMRTGKPLINNYNGIQVNFNRTFQDLYTINHHIKIGKYMRYLAEKYYKFSQKTN